VDKSIAEFKPDVVHVHNFFYVASPSVLYAAHRNKVPVVVTLHNYRLICSGALLMRNSLPCELCVDQTFPLAGVRYGCHRNSKVETAHLTMATGLHKVFDTWNRKVALYISLTEFAQNKFVHSSLKLDPERVIVKPNSVGDYGFRDGKGRERFFLYVGRLSSEKGVDVLIRSFKESKRVVEIIGDGPLKQEVENAASEHPNIIYSGYKDRSYISDQLKRCRALIVPSVCYESLPTAVLEAFSAGTPVVISDIGNLNEIVTDNYNGLHFKTNDSADLGRRIEQMDSDPAKYVHLYLNARKTYQEKYTLDVNYEQAIRIYKRAIEMGV
jgi:glycosyltransferase involved in cell wall biosynthesis